MARSIVHPIIDARRHDAVLFDLDGVVTDTASVHAQTWALLFDGFLQRRVEQVDEDDSPFRQADYLRHVDGRIDSDGFLTVTGRIKEIFKTSGGKYIAPPAIEAKFMALMIDEYVAAIYG